MFFPEVIVLPVCVNVQPQVAEEEEETSAAKKQLIEEARAVFADPHASREAVAAAVAAMNAA